MNEKQYTEIGDTSTNLLLKTKGFVRILVGNSIIDLFDSSNLSTSLPEILKNFEERLQALEGKS